MKQLALLVAFAIAAAVLGRATSAFDVPDAPGHSAWYASRAAGLVAYLGLWVGIVGGLLMSSAWFDGIVSRARLLAIHQTATVSGVVLGVAHALLLIPDGYTNFGLVDVAVPFASYSDPALTGMGTIALYLAVIVTASFWFRGAIGPVMWRRIHYAGFLAWGGALWHGLALGTDTGLAWVQVLYLGTGLLVIFGFVVRFTYAKPARQRAAKGVPAGTATTS